MIDPLFRTTVSLVISQGIFVFSQYSYLASLVLGNVSEPLGVILEASVIALVVVLP
eukprot:CAMPEP_0197930682 /NCGR_PEP_ID=MMETSP1439-20131203/105869_1 /TAXON_ID=66791 /ORGANISM="Gonyaulax spinifera, Strain CCMP409" /LENGTH=55 /DNA_ID=CAMNT_0043553385 /DNA_START=21 /DNA_END=184 /DNA_ORIENTATION=-